MDIPTQLHVLLEIAAAMLLGGLIGLERESKDKPSGFRTHMLVAGAAALLVSLGDSLVRYVTLPPDADVSVATDPIRIVEAIITGVSFLGAGTIFRREGGGIEGITTAASLLVVSAIGVAVALQQFLLAGSVTVLVLLVLRAVALVEGRIAGRGGGGG